MNVGFFWRYNRGHRGVWHEPPPPNYRAEKIDKTKRKGINSLCHEKDEHFSLLTASKRIFLATVYSAWMETKTHPLFFETDSKNN